MATSPQTIAQMQTEARSRQMADELAAAASITQPPARPTAFPANNDAALQALINESKEKSLEYARLQNEEDRRRWEETERENLQWNARLDAQRADRQALDQAQAQTVSDDHVVKLLAQAQELDAHITAAAKDGPLTEWNVPLDILRARTQILQRLDVAAKERGMPGFDAPATPQHPDTFSDGSMVKIVDNKNGTIEAIFYFRHNRDRVLRCPNPECAGPYFFRSKKGQKFCSAECATPSRKESKRRWWANNPSKHRKAKR